MPVAAGSHGEQRHLLHEVGGSLLLEDTATQIANDSGQGPNFIQGEVPVMLYQSKSGKYRVHVGADGAIKVQHGDWLSKYSAAIYNNYWTIRVFARKSPRGDLVPIKDVNLIYAGETLYHMPTLQAYMKASGATGRVQIATFQKPLVITAKRPPVTKLNFAQGETITGTAVTPMSEDEQKKFILDHLQAEYKLSGEHARFIGELCGRIHEVSEFAEIAETLAELLPKGLVEVLPHGLLHGLESAVEWGGIELFSIVGAVLFSVEAAIQIANDWETGQRLVGLRGVAYGVTSWAFEEPAPLPPAWIRANISPSSLQSQAPAKPLPSSIANYVAKAKAREEEEVQLSLKAWKVGCESARRQMEEKAEKAKESKAKVRALWRNLAEGEPKKLAELVMGNLEERYLDDMPPNVRQAFWSPQPSYPAI